MIFFNGCLIEWTFRHDCGNALTRRLEAKWPKLKPSPWPDCVRDRIHRDSHSGHAQLFRTPNLFQPLSVPDSIGKKLGMFFDEFVHHFPELLGIFDRNRIFFLIEGENDCTIFPGSWLFRLNFRCSFRFSG